MIVEIFTIAPNNMLIGNKRPPEANAKAQGLFSDSIREFGWERNLRNDAYVGFRFLNNTSGHLVHSVDLCVLFWSFLALPTRSEP